MRVCELSLKSENFSDLDGRELVVLLVSVRTGHGPIRNAQSARAPRLPRFHNRLVASSSPTSSTTQSRATTVSLLPAQMSLTSRGFGECEGGNPGLCGSERAALAEKSQPSLCPRKTLSR